jgi:hypothetical protein
MIKDILVSLPIGRLSDSAVNYAVRPLCMNRSFLGLSLAGQQLASSRRTGPKSKKQQKLRRAKEKD